jgi:hypothetical protein
MPEDYQEKPHWEQNANPAPLTVVVPVRSQFADRPVRSSSKGVADVSAGQVGISSWQVQSWTKPIILRSFQEGSARPITPPIQCRVLGLPGSPPGNLRRSSPWDGRIDLTRAGFKPGRRLPPAWRRPHAKPILSHRPPLCLVLWRRAPNQRQRIWVSFGTGLSAALKNPLARP